MLHILQLQLISFRAYLIWKLITVISSVMIGFWNFQMWNFRISMNSTAGHCRPICGILNHSILVSSSSYHYIFDHLLHQVRFRFKLTVIITVLHRDWYKRMPTCFLTRCHRTQIQTLQAGCALQFNDSAKCSLLALSFSVSLWFCNGCQADAARRARIPKAGQGRSSAAADAKQK